MRNFKTFLTETAVYSAGTRVIVSPHSEPQEGVVVKAKEGETTRDIKDSDAYAKELYYEIKLDKGGIVTVPSGDVVKK